MTEDQDRRFVAATERGMPHAQAAEAVYGPGYDPVTKDDVYFCEVSLGVLTATRPIGARVRLTDLGGTVWEGRITDLTESDRARVYYRLHLDTGSTREPEQMAFDLPLSHRVTLLSGREGRPEDGHTFRITFDSRMASGIQAAEDSEPRDYRDADDFGGPPMHVEVRAWSLKAALLKAAEVPLRDWRLPSGISLWHARDEDLNL